ncbi:MAG: PDZ domain-containing protein [Acidobacteriia bacterium]|nr:PDZ domain-containing protein [Terriglobia bacterium]
MRTPTTWVIALVATCLFLTATLAHASEPSALTYRDPANRFTIVVPAGWKIRPLGDSVQIVRGDSYASVLLFAHNPDAAALVEELGQKMGKKWKRFESLGHVESTLAGLKGTTVSFSGENAQGLPAMLKLSGVSSNNTAYVLVTGAPKSELPKVQDTLVQIEASFTLLQAEKPAPDQPSPTLGLEVSDLNADDAAGFGLSDISGALVVSLAQSGPAQQAGVLLHDLIVGASGQNIDSAAMLQQVIKSHRPGDVVDLEILRLTENAKVEHITLKATVGIAPKPQ